jgi:iron complex transport system substrate-binding protein
MSTTVSEQTAKAIESTATAVIDAAFQLHRTIGPGLLESFYESILARDLERRGHKIARQRAFSFEYNGMRFANEVRVDLLVDDRLIVEVKSTGSLLPVHSMQLLTYLRVADLPLGLLINFGGSTLKSGLKRVINGTMPSCSSCLRVNQTRATDGRPEG